MQKRHKDREQYFMELAATSEKYYIPYVASFIPVVQSLRVLEIGCGEGGNLLPFLERGCQVTGLDISETRIAQAAAYFAKRGLKANLIAGDFLRTNPEELGGFDLILMHDVIEHVQEKHAFLSKAKALLKPDGLFFVGFPAWQMPFGGHQQICHNRMLSKFPFIHLLPPTMYEHVLKKGGESPEMIAELLDIKKCRTTIELFEDIIDSAEYKIVDRQLYFINPHYEIKFNLTPRKLNALWTKLKGVRNFLSTSCFYMLRAK